MAKDINLLPDVTLAEEKELRIKKLLTLISVSAMLISIIGVIVVFAIQIFLQRQLDEFIADNNALREDISQYAQQELEYRAYISKLSAISLIRSEAINHETYITKLTDLLPNGIEITSVQITEDLITSISGRADSSDNINNFLRNLLTESAKSDGYFANVSLENLALDQEGSFQFRISMTAQKI